MHEHQEPIWLLLLGFPYRAFDFHRRDSLRRLDRGGLHVNSSTQVLEYKRVEFLVAQSATTSAAARYMPVLGRSLSEFRLI